MIKVDGLEIRRLADSMSDEEFFLFCQANPELRIERDKNHNIIVMTPIGGESGLYESELIFALNLWNKMSQTGLVFSSSAGFRLPNGAVRSPDVSWMPIKKWLALSEKEKKSFPPLTPDFVAELRSESDHLDDLLEKMKEYIEQGARLGWLLDPQEKNAYIFRNKGDSQILSGWTQKLSGEEVLPGFEFDLSNLKLPE